MTPVAFVKPLPEMVTLVPPDIDPLVVDRPVTFGGLWNMNWPVYVNWSSDEVVDVPKSFATVTSTVVPGE